MNRKNMYDRCVYQRVSYRERKKERKKGEKVRERESIASWRKMMEEVGVSTFSSE